MGTHFRLLVLLSLLFNSTAQRALADQPVASCAATLAGIIDKTFERVASFESDPTRAENLQKLLKSSRPKVEARVRELCPDGLPCPPATLSYAVSSAVEEEIAKLEAPNVTIGWRVWLTVGTSVLAYVGSSTAAQTYMNSITATMTVAFLTYFGTSVLDAIGAPVLEFLLPPVRRLIYSNNNMAIERDLDRNTSQQRHRIIYMLQQELISQTESYGRSTDTEVILRMIGVLSTCSTGGDCAKGRERSAEIIAKLLSHVVKQYPEIDLRDSDYAEWVQVLFARWEIAPELQSEFITQVMTRLRDRYDLTIRTNETRERKYQAILKSWFGLVPVS